MYNYASIVLPWFESWLGFSGSIPNIYWNVYSEEQRYKWLCKQLCKLVEYSNEQTTLIAENRNAINELAAELAKFESPEFFEANYKAIVEKWINSNLDYIYRYTIKQIYFALDDSGHLVGYIPESWNDIVFQTPMDYSNKTTYGRLILSYELSTIAGYPTGNERY